MPPQPRKKEPRPLFIYWQFPAVKTDQGEVHGRVVTRKSERYLRFAEYLLNNPPNKTPFRPSAQGFEPMTVQTYRGDVVDWVSRRMMQSLQEDPGADEGDHFAKAIEELHKLPWSPGSQWRGFYFVQPNPKEIKAVPHDDLWALEAMGKTNLQYPKVRGGLGSWAEPKFENMEAWYSRIAILTMLRSAENLAQAALTGRSIGALGQAQLLNMIQAGVRASRLALPPESNAKQLSPGKER